MQKLFYLMDNVGRARYTVNFHDGEAAHADGSPFYGVRIFSNKKFRDRFVRELKRAGYSER